MARRVYISHVDADLAAVRALTAKVGHPHTGIEIAGLGESKPPFHLPDAETARARLLMAMEQVVVTVCMIGADMHWSPWVHWEIETAARLGHGLVGVRLRAGIHDFIPPALRLVHAPIVDSHVGSIVASIERSAFVAGRSR